MAGRLTWRVRRWSEGSWVEPFPDLRAAYGDEVANTVEHAADVIRDHRDQPTAQDIKRTLQAIAARPAAADVNRLDGFTSAALLRFSWRHYREPRLERLSGDALARCATDALQALRPRAGRPPTDAVALQLVRTLVALRPDQPASQRDEMLAAALKACKLGAGGKTIARLLAEAREGSLGRPEG